MGTTFEKIRRSKALDIIRNIISSKYFPFATVAVLLLCYYLGWDLVAAYYLGIVIVLILLLLEDITPFVAHLPYITLVVSLEHTPSSAMGTPDYYTQPAVLAQLIIVVSLMVCALVYRLVLCCVRKKLKLTPMFYGLCFLSFALVLNGLFSDTYTPKNLLFGAALAICLLLIFVGVKDNIKTDKNCFEKLAYSFMALSVLLIIELIVAYATTENLFIDGTINRSALIFGWGVYNTYGLMILLCLPASLYLASKHKYGYLFTAYSLLIFAAAILSCSRQAMVGAFVIYPVCLIVLLVRGKNRIPNLCITAAAVLAGIVLLCVFREHVADFFKKIFENVFVNGELNGSGRWRIWKEALGFFGDAPLLGSGFYVDYGYTGEAALTFIPKMCHNTILEFMAAGGIVGIVAYLVHRAQTVMSFFKNPTLERFFIAMTIAVILILSLLDVHIFNIFPTIIYSSLVAVLDKSQDKVESENNA